MIMIIFLQFLFDTMFYSVPVCSDFLIHKDFISIVLVDVFSLYCVMQSGGSVMIF